MNLTIAKTLNLTTDYHNTPPSCVDKLFIIHEAYDGELVQYYINHLSHAEGDKNTYAIGILVKNEETHEEHYEYIDYPNAIWNRPKSRITRQAIDNLGIKAFPNVGSVAFYKLAYRNISCIVAPVNYNNDRSKAPSINYIISEDSKSITITLQDPTEIQYIAYRINFVYGPHTLEYVTYEKTITITNFPVTGEYILYCSGYVSNGEGASEISLEEFVDLVGLYDEWPSITPGAGDKYLIGLDFNEQGFAIGTMSDGQEIISDNPAPSGGGGGGGGGSSVYIGQTAPASNLGEDGSLYVQYELTEVSNEIAPVFNAMFVKINSIWVPIDSTESGAIYNIVPAVLSGTSDPDASNMYEGQQYLQYGNTAESLYIPLNSWFNTSYVVNNNTKVVFKGKIPEPSSANSFACPFGSRRASKNNGFWFGVRSSGATNVIIGHGGIEATQFSATPYYDRDIQVTYDSTAFEITNGVDTNTYAYAQFDYSNNTWPIYIGTLNENNADYGSVCHCALYLYALEVYESDVLIHNFIPYSNNDVACLKDTITNTIINITGDPATYYPSIEKIIASWYKLHNVVQPMQVSNQYSPTININQGGQGIVMWRIKYYSHDGTEYLGREYVEDGDDGEWVPPYGSYAFATEPNGTAVADARSAVSNSISLYVIELDSIALLKTDIANTDYIRLSNAIGDGATFNGRYFTRTTDEPLIFVNVTSGYSSYGVLSLSSTKPAETHNGYGDLVHGGQKVINNTTVHLYVMSGMWPSGYPTYTIDNVSVSLEQSYPISVSNSTFTITSHETEITAFIERYIALLQ